MRLDYIPMGIGNKSHAGVLLIRLCEAVSKNLTNKSMRINRKSGDDIFHAYVICVRRK